MLGIPLIWYLLALQSYLTETQILIVGIPRLNELN